jgi:AraC-like DNA-binding protein
MRLLEMSEQTLEEILARRFQISTAATLVARPESAVAFTRLKSDQAQRGRSLDIPGDSAFAFQVPLQPSFFDEVWRAGKLQRLPAARPGAVYLFDLSDNPVVALEKPFDTVRLYIQQSALDELAYERGLRRIGGLKAKETGAADMILLGMAQTLAATLAQSNQTSPMFTEYMALAFHEHVSRAYGNATALTPTPRGGLAPWQLRRVHEFIHANLAGSPSIEQLASETGLSSSHFARAFKQTTGLAPHRWLLQQRIERAKELLQRHDLTLSDIALMCGFVDQSHFTRVFTQLESNSPGKWRRLRQ